MNSREKINRLKARMQLLHIYEEDLLEKFILGTGSGGQKINKTSSCVYLKHLPSGIQVKCQQGRSRESNRYLALVELCDRMENKILSEKQLERAAMEKIRRQKRRRTVAGQKVVLENKRRQSKKKSMRRQVSKDNHD